MSEEKFKMDEDEFRRMLEAFRRSKDSTEMVTDFRVRKTAFFEKEPVNEFREDMEIKPLDSEFLQRLAEECEKIPPTYKIEITEEEPGDDDGGS